MATATLTPADLEAALAELPGWSAESGKLHKAFRFGSFVEAFGFMASLALVSESKNHHPEWRNVYNRVEIDLVTHDAGGITRKDVDWARAAEALLAAR